MFDNVSKKIMILAKANTFIGIIFFVVMGVLVMRPPTSSFLGGMGIIIFGSLGAWAGSLALYGFGKLVENSEIIAKNIAPEDTAPKDAPSADCHAYDFD